MQTGQRRKSVKTWRVNREKVLTGNFGKRLVRNGPENPGSQVSWIFVLTFSLYPNVQTTCSPASGSRIFGTSSGKPGKHALSSSISVLPGTGRQWPGPTEIEEDEHGS